MTITRALFKSCVFFLLACMLMPEGYGQALESTFSSIITPRIDGVLTDPSGHPADGGLIPLHYGGRNGLYNQNGHLEQVRIFADAKHGVNGNRYNILDSKYASLAKHFRGTGLVTWESQRASIKDHFDKYATFFFAGNCHTIITAAHVFYKKNGSLRNPDFFFYPNGYDTKPPIKVNFALAKSDGRVHYIKRGVIGTDRWESSDVIGVSLKHSVPNCGAYRVFPLSDALQRKLVKDDDLISVGFDGGAQNILGIPQKILVPHCQALTGDDVNLPWLKDVHFQPYDLLFNDCDDLPGRSGGPMLVVVRKKLYVVGVMVGQVVIRNLSLYKTTQGIPVPAFYKQFHGNVVPDSNWYKYQFPNIAVRFRSTYVEKHPRIDLQEMSHKRYACLRAREIHRSSAFWVVQDAIRDYHQKRSQKTILASCH